MFQDPIKLEYIKEKLLLTWSPEQIANTPCELDMPSMRTIYRWIYEKYIDVNLKVLRRKGKSRGKKETRGKFNLGKSIRKRDRSVYKRNEFGHWEADTVVSGRGKSKVCFATLAERKTRYYIAIKMPNRNADTMAKAIIAALSEFPDEAVKSITCDRGTEFANWSNIEKRLNCDVYFADPYCAWQKGTNENSNGFHELCGELRKYLNDTFLNCRSLLVWQFQRNIVASFSFSQRHKTGFAFSESADYSIRFPVTGILPFIYLLVPFSNRFSFVIFASCLFYAVCLSRAAQHFQVSVH